jgi:hypothetical protein
MKPISDEKRAAMIAALESGERPYIVGQRFRMRIGTLFDLVGWGPKWGTWPDMPADAFEDDPRACRPMPGRPILGLRWVS